MTFGKKLQSLRKEKGMSQDALANQLYVTRQSVSQWENDRTMPSVDLLIKISEIFDTTVDALLGKPETESIPQPMAQAKTLTDKKSIKTAMRYEYSTAVIVLVSMALLFLGMYAVMMFIENNIFSLTPEVLARFSGSIFCYIDGCFVRRGRRSADNYQLCPHAQGGGVRQKTRLYA